jgi:hypothetical protein
VQAVLETIREQKRTGTLVAPTRATFADVATAWFESRTRLRDRTRERYELALRCHVLPRLGNKPIASITEDDVARLIAAMQKGMRVGEDGVERPRTKKQWNAKGELVDVPAGPHAGWTRVLAPRRPRHT